ncbi:hypothetical protein [Flavobacterium sp. GCM10023249]|uniref:hypothetical protein n=1 Tax=unclassified Flavobacterium TaxID=196869 RepID=UPI003611D977
MTVQPLDPDQFGPILFETYRIEGHTTFDDLLAVHHQFKREHQDHSVIITLDDLGQAEYTSTHAILAHDLDTIEGHDLTGIDASAFENGEHLGYLSTPSEFFIQRENFLQKAQECSFSDACDSGLTIDDSEIQLLEKIQQSPITYLDKQVLVKIVPARHSYEALCGFPNGYFSSDLDPFENYALARHLHDHYGYTFLGIGASLLGFIREQPLEVEAAKALATDLIALYNSDESSYERMLALIENRTYLFLKYTEYLA